MGDLVQVILVVSVILLLVILLSYKKFSNLARGIKDKAFYLSGKMKSLITGPPDQNTIAPLLSVPSEIADNLPSYPMSIEVYDTYASTPRCFVVCDRAGIKNLLKTLNVKKVAITECRDFLKEKIAASPIIPAKIAVKIYTQAQNSYTPAKKAKKKQELCTTLTLDSSNGFRDKLIRLIQDSGWAEKGVVLVRVMDGVGIQGSGGCRMKLFKSLSEYEQLASDKVNVLRREVLLPTQAKVSIYKGVSVATTSNIQRSVIAQTSHGISDKPILLSDLLQIIGIASQNISDQNLKGFILGIKGVFNSPAHSISDSSSTEIGSGAHYAHR